MKKQTYQVHGMHCTSCAQIISKKVAKNDGIESCNINFATKQAVIEYTQEEIPLDQINQSIQEL
jgi:Cu+-exporting ATPase